MSKAVWRGCTPKPLVGRASIHDGTRLLAGAGGVVGVKVEPRRVRESLCRGRVVRGGTAVNT